MRQWRVGTFTMGLLLILLGGALLIAQFNQLAVVDFFMKWWPLLLVCLGIEVLVYSFYLQKDQAKIKYDLFSIFIILIIVCSGIGIQMLNETDLTTYIRQMATVQNFKVQTEETEFTLPPNVSKVIITAPSCGLKVGTWDKHMVQSSGSASVAAENLSHAKALLKESSEVISKQTDDTLYISFNTVYSGSMSYQATVTSYSLMVPDSVPVEIHGDYAPVQIEGVLKSDWKLSNCDTANITLPAENSLKIDAIVSDPSSLQGNVRWEIQNQTASNPDSETTETNIHGQTILGNALNHLIITNSGSVTVNQL